MGRDEHRSRNNSFLAQTPKRQISDGIDVEFSEELADEADLKALERSNAATKRVKNKK